MNIDKLSNSPETYYAEDILEDDLYDLKDTIAKLDILTDFGPAIFNGQLFFDFMFDDPLFKDMYDLLIKKHNGEIDFSSLEKSNYD